MCGDRTLSYFGKNELEAPVFGSEGPDALWYREEAGSKEASHQNESQVMSDKIAAAPEERVQVTYKKTIVPFEQEGPVEEPLFINMCQVAFHDDVVYIDVGIVPLDEVLERTGTELTFDVLNRLVMGVPTLRNLREQITGLLDRLESHETH